MSTTEYKTVIRKHVPVLKGLSPSEALEYFEKCLGRKAFEVEREDDGDKTSPVEYFCFYDPYSHKSKRDMIIPTGIPHFVDGWDHWYVDYILNWEDDDNSEDPSVVSLEKLQEIWGVMNNVFGSEGECSLVSYSWYNCGDEPIEFNI